MDGEKTWKKILLFFIEKRRILLLLAIEQNASIQAIWEIGHNYIFLCKIEIRLLACCRDVKDNEYLPAEFMVARGDLHEALPGRIVVPGDLRRLNEWSLGCVKNTLRRNLSKRTGGETRRFLQHSRIVVPGDLGRLNEWCLGCVRNTLPRLNLSKRKRRSKRQTQ